MKVSHDASPLLTTLLHESSLLFDQSCFLKMKMNMTSIKKRWTKCCVRTTKFQRKSSILQTRKRIQVTKLRAKVDTFRCIPTQNRSGSTNLWQSLKNVFSRKKSVVGWDLTQQKLDFGDISRQRKKVIFSPHKSLLNVRKGYIFEKLDFGRFSRQNTKMLFSCQATLGLIKTCRLSHNYLRVESEVNQFKISRWLKTLFSQIKASIDKT